MALPIKFNQLRYRVGLGFDWTASTTYFVLLDSGAWVPDPDDDYVQTVTAAGATPASFDVDRPQIVNPVVTLDDAGDRALWGADDFVYSNVALGVTFDVLLLFNLVNDDTDSWLCGAWDLGPQTGDGNDINITITGGNLFAW